MSSLLFAIERNPINLDDVKELLERGVDVNLGDAENVSPLLHLLIREHDLNVTVMTMLLENGADVNARANCCNTAALHHALLRPDCDENMIHVLLQHGSEVNAVDNALYTPLHYAVIKFVEESSLVEMRYDFWTFGRADDWADLVSPHFKPGSNVCKERIVEQLLLRGAVVDALNDFGETALHLAVRNPNCSANVIRLLLRNGAHVNAKSYLNLTPLLYAVMVNWDNEAVITELLKGGANCNARCNKGISALHHAVRNPFCTLNVTKALLSRGALVNQTDRDLKTPLRYAVEVMHEFKLDHIEELLENGASVEAMDTKGVNPLAYALKDSSCTVELAKLLLKFTVLENLTRFIFRAATSTCCPLDVCEELLNHGIDIDCKIDECTLVDEILKDICRGQNGRVERAKTLFKRTDWVRLLLQKGYYVSSSCIWEKVIRKLLKNNFYFSEEERALEFLEFITKYALLQMKRPINFSIRARRRRSRFETSSDEEERLAAELCPDSSGDYLSSSYSSRLSQFQSVCQTEIRAMKRTPVSGWDSLFKFLWSYEMCDEKQTARELVGILSSGQLPVYSEVIANRMERTTLIEILTEQIIILEAEPGGTSLVLPPNCVFKIAIYLSKVDIKNCILAFASHINSCEE